MKIKSNIFGNKNIKIKKLKIIIVICYRIAAICNEYGTKWCSIKRVTK